MKIGKTFFTLALAGTLLLGAAQLCGATTVVQRLTMSLTAYGKDDPVYKANTTTVPLVKIKITEKTIIAMISEESGMYFSPVAQLVMVYTDAGRALYVKDAGAYNDVSAFFPSWDHPNAVIFPYKEVFSSTSTTTTGTMYSTDDWHIQADGFDITLNGLCTGTHRIFESADDSYEAVSSSTPVSGVIGYGGGTMVVSGTVKVSSTLMK